MGTRWGSPWCRGRCCDPKPLPGDPSRRRFNAGLGQWAEGTPSPGRSRPAASAPPGDAPTQIPGPPEERPEPGLRPRPRSRPPPRGPPAALVRVRVLETHLKSLALLSSHRGAGIGKPRPFRSQRYSSPPSPGAQFQPGGLWVSAWRVCSLSLRGREKEGLEGPFAGGVEGRRSQ